MAVAAAATSCNVAEGAEIDERTAENLGVSPQAASAAAFVTSVKPYVVSVSPEYAIQPLLSSGDRVPETSDASKQYQLVGIPDGIGLVGGPGNTRILYMNHEFVNTQLSEPTIGQALNRGSFVSRYVLDKNARVLSGERAYDSVYSEETLVGPAAAEDNTTPAFGRFCSGSVVGTEAGFDRTIYFAGEESGGSGTFDGKGGLGVAIFDNELHTMPKFGRFSWENTLAQRRALSDKTVLIGMEDGPASPDNQLVMWVGQRNFAAGASTMDRNGLRSGKMYALRSTTPGMSDEISFSSGSINAEWVEVTSAETLTESELETRLDDLGAFGFIRTEDGAFDKTNPRIYYFVTTGSATGNMLGRMYKLTLAENPTEPVTLELLYNGDSVDAAGGDIAFAPDNIDTSADYIMVNEDGTSQSRPEYQSRAREGSVWRFSIKDGFKAARVAELNPPGRDAVPVASGGTTAGIWETTGIHSAPWFGKDAWVMNVQAHGPTTAPGSNTAEDGQLVLMVRTSFNALTSE